MMKRLVWFLALGVVGSACSSPATGEDSSTPAPSGWLSWRGPDQNGTSPEVGLPEDVTLGGENHLWSYPLSGRGTPVIADGRVYALGYEGEGPELVEVLVCLDADTGERLWERRNSDFLSDVIYTRYAIGSPTVDPETGNVFALTGSGLFFAYTRDGEILWEKSLIENLGRLSFPNGRVGAPLVIGDLVIMHFIFTSWGPFGPASDRFFAFDKHTGDVVWGSTPGIRPRDSSFSYPVVEERDGRLLLYAGLGGGSIACVDVRTGEPVWKFQLAIGGVNSSALLYGDNLIVIHGKENVDSSNLGRMISLKLGGEPGEGGKLGADAELWRNNLVAFTSSPVLVGNRVYQTTLTGDLVCVDADTGHELWEEKLASSQLHASPVAGDGKLFVPMNNGSFYIVRPSDSGAEVLDTVQLEGNCLGAPAIADGRVYVHTTDRLYCFGSIGDSAPPWTALPDPDGGPVGVATRLQLTPADVTVRAGEELSFDVRTLDALGRRVGALNGDGVQLTLPANYLAQKAGVGIVKASHDGLLGSARVRVVPRIPWSEDFESIELDKPGTPPWAFPPGYWLSARPKWKVTEHDGSQVVARRLDNPLFQRTMSLIGHPDDANYTVQMDFLSDGNRRTLCEVGVVNQRYLIKLKGNHQILEVSSNEERLKESVKFRWKAGTWYRMKSRVDRYAHDVAQAGSWAGGMVRAKVWPRDEPEPDDWTITVHDPHVRTHGAAGVYAFTPQSRFTAYIDNLSVTPND